MPDIFPLRINADMAWLLRGRIRPGVSLEGFTSLAPPALHIDHIAHRLRNKVNAAILRFVDEANLKRSDFVTIYIDVDEAWMIDLVIDFDGAGGLGSEILLQTIRMMWAHDMGLPFTLSREDPLVSQDASPPQDQSDPFVGVWNKTNHDIDPHRSTA